jgi:hypothetical protein
MNSSIQPLIELDAAIVELEEAIPYRAKWDWLLKTLRKLFIEAQDNHRKGNVLEALLTLNCAFGLIGQAKESSGR